VASVFKPFQAFTRRLILREHLDQTVEHNILFDFSFYLVGGTLHDLGGKVWPNLEFSRKILACLGCAGEVSRVLNINVEKRQDIFILDKVLAFIVFTNVVVGFQGLSSDFKPEK